MILTVTANPSVDRTLEVRGFREGGTFTAELVAFRAAGKGVNVSRCLAALGVPSVATGLVGRSQSEAFRRGFEPRPGAAAVDSAFVGVAAETRTCTTVVDPEREGETHIRERGGGVSPAEVDELERVVGARAARGGWVAACGSLPQGLSAERFAGILARAREAGARVALDSSADGLRAARAFAPDLLKPNRVELAELAGREVSSVADAVAAARSLLGRSARAVLATLGAEGAVLVDDGGAFLARARAERFVSSVGAGDAALAGYLWADSRGEGPEGRLAAAVAAGAASLAEPVAGALDPERLRRVLAGVAAEALDAPGDAAKA